MFRGLRGGLVRPLLIVLAVLALAAPAGGADPAPAGPARTESPAARADRSRVGFRTHADLVQHHRKHGREFGDIGVGEYLARAQALRDRRAGGTVLEIVRGDGVITRFDRKTGAFLAFEKSGVIRTFFRPRDGERYFRRQALRYGRQR